MEREDYYARFLEIRGKYFEDIKATYFFAIDIAPKKENAHNVFQQEKMRPEEQRFQKELGELSRILIDIRHEMELDSRIDEHKEFNLRFDKIEKSKKQTVLKLIAEFDGLSLMYKLWHNKTGTLQNGKGYFERYEQLSLQILKQLTEELNSRVEKARNKKLACENFVNEYMNPKREQLAPKLGALGRFTNEVEDIYELDSSKNREEIFNEKFEAIPFGKREESLELLAEFHANWLMLNVEGKTYRKYANNPMLSQIDEPNNIEPDESPLIWQGTNETEFVQLIYALHEAGYLKHEENEITKLVTQFAELLNFQLGKNWQSNFSKSINARKPFYEPEIFKKMLTAFKLYREKQINKKKKN